MYFNDNDDATLYDAVIGKFVQTAKTMAKKEKKKPSVKSCEVKFQ